MRFGPPLHLHPTAGTSYILKSVFKPKKQKFVEKERALLGASTTKTTSVPRRMNYKTNHGITKTKTKTKTCTANLPPPKKKNKTTPNKTKKNKKTTNKQNKQTVTSHGHARVERSRFFKKRLQLSSNFCGWRPELRVVLPAGAEQSSRSVEHESPRRLSIVIGWLRWRNRFVSFARAYCRRSRYTNGKHTVN